MNKNKPIDILDTFLHDQDFTDTERTVITYILDHLDEVPTMNIGNLAKETFASNGTIIRICRKVGCNGFRELKYELTKEYEGQRYSRKDVDFNTPFGTHQSVVDIIDSMSDLYRESVTVTQQHLNQAKVREAAQLLNKSNRIFLFATGDSYITAEGFSNKLVKLGVYPVLANTYGDQLSVAENIKKNDVAIFISYTGENQTNCLPILKKKNVPIIGITANEESLINKLSDITIQIPYREGKKDERIGTFYSQVSISLVLNILYSLLYSLHN